MKAPIPAPTVVREVAVEGENVASIKIVCHLHQTCVCEICQQISQTHVWCRWQTILILATFSPSTATSLTTVGAGIGAFIYWSHWIECDAIRPFQQAAT